MSLETDKYDTDALQPNMMKNIQSAYLFIQAFFSLRFFFATGLEHLRVPAGNESAFNTL